MAAYPLNKLLNLRHDREERARREVVLQREQVAEHEQRLTAAAQELADFKTWRVAEEQRLFAEVREKALNSADLDVLKQEIGDLRQQQADKKQALEEQQQALATARTDLEQRIADLKNAQHNRSKLEGHMDLWTEADRKVRVRREENEAEETLSLLATRGGKS